MPFLLTHAGEMDKLKASISDLSMFRYLVKTEEGKFDLIKAWTVVGYCVNNIAKQISRRKGEEGWNPFRPPPPFVCGGKISLAPPPFPPRN